MCTREKAAGFRDRRGKETEEEDEMGPGTKKEAATSRASGYFRAGWTLLVIAILAMALPILATAAQPHVVWLFSTSYGAVGMVLGVTLIRVAHRVPEYRTGRHAALTSCRS
jgi:hypothetical protein